MVDVTLVQRSLADCALRASMASRCGDEDARAQALEEADGYCRLLDRLHAEANYAVLVDNRHG